MLKKCHRKSEKFGKITRRSHPHKVPIIAHYNLRFSSNLLFFTKYLSMDVLPVASYCTGNIKSHKVMQNYTRNHENKKTSIRKFKMASNSGVASRYPNSANVTGLSCHRCCWHQHHCCLCTALLIT